MLDYPPLHVSTNKANVMDLANGVVGRSLFSFVRATAFTGGAIKRISPFLVSVSRCNGSIQFLLRCHVPVT